MAKLSRWRSGGGEVAAEVVERKQREGEALADGNGGDVDSANGGEAGAAEGKNGFPRRRVTLGWRWLGKTDDEVVATVTTTVR